MKKKILISIAILGMIAVASLLLADTVIMSDDMQSYTANATITDSSTYDFQNFPLAGGSGPGNPSTKWETDTGSFIAKTDSGGGKWGAIPSSDLIRLNTQATAQDAVVEWRYKAGGASTAVDVWLRFQTQFWLYAVQFDRSDQCVVAKKKLPTNSSASGEWGGVAAGHGAEIANKGIYYVLRVDSGFAGSPCNQDGRTWTQLGFSDVSHTATLDAGTSYDYKATITTVPANTGTCGVAINCTQIKLYRDGVLAISWTDENDGWNFNKTRTNQQDCDAGWFTTVTGYTSAWCLPIYLTGKSGIRDDDAINFWIDNFVLSEAGSSPPPTPIATASSSIVQIKNVAVKVKNASIKIKGI